ncbi:hypothetical protein tb265_13900 [Gemmatimonadetes bacterium T265]|nr:hypothetical protein tb265_13900 [Gemmatimonadetes bacterium T265]
MTSLSHARRRVVALGATFGAAALAACNTDKVTALNGPVLNSFQPITSRGQVQQLATGLLDRDRSNYTTQLIFFSILGRDLYRIDPSEPRWTTVLLDSRTPDNSIFVGAGIWTTPYQTINGANFLIKGANATGVLSAAEKSATVGFAQTMKALEYLSLIRSRDTVGIAIQAVQDSTVPIRCKPAALAYISALLDSGSTALAAAGTAAFPFALPSGFAGFTAPTSTTGTSFRQFNRALKAITEMYLGFVPLEAAGNPLTPPDAAHMTAALANFDSSFYNATPTTASLNTGIYYTFSTASGETQNPLTNTSVYRVDPKVVASAEPGDPRFAAKVDTSAATSALSIPAQSDTVTSRYGVLYPRAATDPLALLKNSELVLSRAQVLWTLGRDAEALALVDAVRQANGLPAKTSASFTDRVDFLVNGILQEKRYELLFESPTRWVDFRDMGILSRIGVELPLSGGKLPFPVFPIPNGETTARNGNVACQP